MNQIEDSLMWNISDRTPPTTYLGHSPSLSWGLTGAHNSFYISTKSRECLCANSLHGQGEVTGISPICCVQERVEASSDEAR